MTSNQRKFGELAIRTNFQHNGSEYRKVNDDQGQPITREQGKWVALRSPFVDFTPDTWVKLL